MLSLFVLYESTQLFLKQSKSWFHGETISQIYKHDKTLDSRSVLAIALCFTGQLTRFVFLDDKRNTDIIVSARLRVPAALV